MLVVATHCRLQGPAWHQAGLPGTGKWQTGYAALAFVPVPYRYGLWILALCIELVTPLTSSGGRLHNELPPDVRHLPERYGLFTLILLGQTVSSAAQGLIKSGFETNTVLATMLGGVIIIGLWWAYFDRLDDDAVRQVSAGKSTRPYTIWLYLHLPLTVSLTMAGVGLTLAIEVCSFFGGHI
ncbi:MAG: hypothetical protein EOO63_16510, partial [Hymenobacter sp.]